MGAVVVIGNTAVDWSILMNTLVAEEAWSDEPWIRPRVFMLPKLRYYYCEEIYSKEV